MANVLAHCGPDDAGHWVDEDAGIALAHRRLSILDLFATGHQPMVSASGRFVLVFNGEIYNYAELRKELERSGFQAPPTTDAVQGGTAIFNGGQPLKMKASGHHHFPILKSQSPGMGCCDILPEAARGMAVLAWAFGYGDPAGGL